MPVTSDCFDGSLFLKGGGFHIPSPQEIFGNASASAQTCGDLRISGSDDMRDRRPSNPKDYGYQGDQGSRMTRGLGQRREAANVGDEEKWDGRGASDKWVIKWGQEPR